MNPLRPPVVAFGILLPPRPGETDNRPAEAPRSCRILKLAKKKAATQPFGFVAALFS
jgi:hypothetical protein